MSALPDVIGPGRRETPRATRFRLAGPYWVNGMRVWRVFDLHGNRQVGPDHMLFGEAKKELIDLAMGKTSFYFRGVPFKRSEGNHG